MTERETGFLGRYGRFVWGGAAALLLLALAASFVLSGSSVAAAEQEAQQRAENVASSVVQVQLTPDLLTRDIDGTDYRDLTLRVQAGILSDERFQVVRIWRLDGRLIYSTAQRDDVNGVAAPDDQWIQRALGGQTVSVLSSEGTYHEGLRRPSEELFQSFVPIRLSGDTVDGVVQLDQRYGAIHSQAMRLWRPLQIAAFLLLIGAGVMLVRSFRDGPTYGAGGVERRQSRGRRADDVSVRDAVDRADHAERRVRDTEKRMAELEAQLARAPSTATVEELDLKLRASEAEREELAGTVRRLQSDLTESQADATLAREGSAGTRAETKRVNKLIADAEANAITAERKAAAAEQKAQEAVKRASVNAERNLDLEAQLRDAQKTAAGRSDGIDRRVEGARRRESGDQRVASELERVEGERGQLVSKLDELERALTEARHRAESSERDLAIKKHELNAAADATASAAALEERATAAELSLVDSEERFADAQGRLSQALEKLRELEAARAAHDEEAPAPLVEFGAGAELETRIAELEHARRADVDELQRAHESFASTQLELSNTTRKLREAEARVKELERSGGAPAKARRRSEPVPEPAPVPTYVAVADDPGAWGEVEDPFGDSSDAFADPPDRWSDPAGAVEEPVEDEPAEGLSLRERLARAAAARKRIS